MTEDSRDPDRQRRTSRRRLLQVTAGVGASTLALGGIAAGQSEVDRRCADGDSIQVGDGAGLVIANQWSTQDVDQCVFRNDDGSYGWEWERGETDACPDDCPNYPEVVIGTKPWSRETDTSIFPVQLGEIDDLAVDLDIDNGASGEEWNLALEWWHTSQRPPNGNAEPSHEIMLILEKNDAHDKDGTIEAGAITDSYGNVIDYWANPDHTDWSFHIFKIAANETPSTIDLGAIYDYLYEEVDDPVGFDSDLWMTGIEIGNETWDHTQGKTTVFDFDVRLDGETATTGVDGEFSDDPTAPAPPSNLSSPATSASSIDLEWDASSDAGTAVDHYVVSVDGDIDHEVSGGTTSTTVSGLSAETSYDVGVAAVDDAGTESSSATLTVTTDAGGDGPPAVDGSQPGDTTGDGLYDDVTGSGESTTNDVTVFFDHVDDPVVAEYPDYYDFDGNGQVSIADVVELFESL